MSDAERNISEVTSAAYQGQVRGEVKRRALFAMITKTAFVAPVVASFALDALTLDKASATSCVSNSSCGPV
ncbi:MAG: hypothetical protein P4L54_04465 [Acidocella sp.]|nr:hypothetical protein [Acidocella sp.]